MQKRARFDIIFTVRGVAQFGSALGSGPRGRGFKSRRLDHLCCTKRLQRQTSARYGVSCRGFVYISCFSADFAIGGIFCSDGCILPLFPQKQVLNSRLDLECFDRVFSVTTVLGSCAAVSLQYFFYFSAAFEYNDDLPLRHHFDILHQKPYRCIVILMKGDLLPQNNASDAFQFKFMVFVR